MRCQARNGGEGVQYSEEAAGTVARVSCDRRVQVHSTWCRFSRHG
ncbi:hypothetical protein LINPERPRIM_LOCUS18946 [Linum perenne]